MAIGWFDNLTDGNNYFINERLETSAWDELEDIYRTKALNTAYNRLYYCKDYSLPTYAQASAVQRIILKKAQAEMAYYLAQHLADEDRRKGLQAQGVTDAGIVKESYDLNYLDKLPIPPFVDELLADFKTAKSFALIDIDRDEDESAGDEVADV
jgi:hypothetical protein